ncbi:sodium/hydrogen antiporter [Nematocida homosporus]|uniref:sodium/hydrogen antiporter n=1 Tax=Nematocida homosporus TaxID=1912981 RepID=UPI00221E75A8|nr:sodium/hydrogen antiporter [Nematocida homosporus]KAI5187853.1 sodium/hydrogen antiporter [Nematocida homosporus]
MKNFAICCSLLGGFVLSFGLISLFVKERLYIAETAVATIFGMVCRQFLSGGENDVLKDNLSNSTFVFHFAHIVLALQLVAVGVTVPRSFMRKNWRPLTALLLPVMTIMFAISTVIIKLVGNLSWKTAMTIGACVTPTDPILASTVLKGKFANKYIPSRLRYLLAVESGANDGLGFPILILPVLFIKYEGTPNHVKTALWEWTLKTWGFEIFLAVILGAIIGMLARVLLKYSIKRLLIDKESFLVYSLALAILVTGVTSLIKSDDLLAVFVAGVAFAWDEDMVRDMKNSHVIEVVDMIFNQSFFILLGLIFPENIFTFTNLATGFLVVLFRRLPAVFLMKLCKLLPGFSTKETIFAGWFGPIGVGAIFFAHHAAHELHNYSAEINDHLLCMVYAIVFTSIIVHGTTAPIIHLHMRRKQRQNKANLYESDTEVERDIDTPNLRLIA